MFGDIMSINFESNTERINSLCGKLQKFYTYDRKWHVYLSLGFGKINNYFVLITGLRTKAF